MVNLFYFWISEETEENIFDYIILTEATFALIFNFLAFILLQLKPPPKNDVCTKLLKWGRIIDMILPFSYGIMLRHRTLTPFVGIAINGLCTGIFNLCKASLIAYLLTIYPIFTYIFLSFIFRYNIFIRRKDVFYFSLTEKCILLAILIIYPCMTIFFFGYYGNEKLSYESGIENFNLANYYLNRNKFTLIIYSKQLEFPTHIFFLLFEVTFLFLNFYLIFAYTIPFENELKRCQKLTNQSVAKQIKYNIRFLRLFVLLPIVLSFLPFTISLFLSFVPGIEKFNFYLSARIGVLLLIHFCISPFTSVYHSYTIHGHRVGGKKIQRTKCVN
uniref:G-protein coupled receptors family 1 profile domain-containing protein n=1 Tax=Strongyloides stercoralis TaxID=6248 RepID=A0A0K0DZE2_STRER